MDGALILRIALLDFVRLYPPHNGETTSSILVELLSNWKIPRNVSKITTDNASDMCCSMAKLCIMLNIRSKKSRVVTDLHMRGIAHIVNFPIGDCLKEVYRQLIHIRSLISALHSSVNRSDKFESTGRSLGFTVALLDLNVVTRWSSTFEMIKNAYNLCMVLNSVTRLTSIVNELRAFAIPNKMWEKLMISHFLSSAVSLRECQSCSN